MLLNLLVQLGFTIVSCAAATTIPYNSGLLIYSDKWAPENDRGGCSDPGYRRTPTSGSTVQLTFTGTSIQVTLLKDIGGTAAVLYVDDNIVATLLTFDSGAAVAFSDCQTTTGGVSSLSPGQHNVTLLNNRDPSPQNPNANIYFVNFQFDPIVTTSSTPASTPTAQQTTAQQTTSNQQTSSTLGTTSSNSNTQPSSSASSSTTQAASNGKGSSKPVGAIVGGVIGGLALLLLGAALILWILRRPTKSQEPYAGQPEYTQWSPSVEPVSQAPTTPWSLGNPAGADIQHQQASSASANGENSANAAPDVNSHVPPPAYAKTDDE